MPKLTKNYYYGKNGERKINCYLINISKDVVQKATIKDDEELKIYAKDGKIIIEKKDKG